jgi:uncharacterized protein YndB with AHSA1/START domain
MQFTAREDVALPIEQVFAAISDFDAFERAAMRRGAQVQRTGAAPDLGRGWSIRFDYRGRERHLRSEIIRHAPPTGLASSGRVGGLTGTLTADLVALSPRRTRLALVLDVTGTTMGARILLQSVRLTRGSLERKLAARVERFARDLEARHLRPTL